MTESTQNTQPTAEAPLTSLVTGKKFELCGCNGKLHGYITGFPATIISVRVGEDVLSHMFDAGEVTAEEKGLIVAQMKAAGLPTEVEGDFEVGVKSALVSMNPMEIATLELLLSLDDE